MRKSLYTSEHGDATDDEINMIRRDGNYGWPDVMGFHYFPEEKIYVSNSIAVEFLMAWTPTIGLSDPIKVNGEKYNARTPEFDFLGDTEIAEILTFIQSQFGNDTERGSLHDVVNVREALYQSCTSCG